MRDAVARAADQARSQGINVTPTLFINGRLLEGVRSYADYERIILQERERQAAPVSPPAS